MSVEVCVLASGSSGNCTLVRSGDSVLLIDAGISGTEIFRRADALGVAPGMVVGICVSHEHSDHVSGIGRIHQQHAIPVYTNRGTSEAMARKPELRDIAYRIFSTGQPFEVGPFTVEPFSVPHDAYEPVGFIVTAAGCRVGVVTDMGIVTALIRERLKNCRAVVVEANHDEQLLRLAKRPEFLKQRIRGRQGHLSNQAATDLVTHIAGPHLEAVFLAHLSEDCNKPEIAMHLVRTGLNRAGHVHVDVHLTYPDQPSVVWKPAA